MDSHEYDLVILGSGAGGLLAALKAVQEGLRPLIIEKRKLVGGSTALSSGVIWLPNNALLARAGVRDTPAMARTYLDALVGTDNPWTSAARKDAFVETAPQVYDLMAASGVRLRYWEDGWPDYYGHRPGGVPRGRSVEPLMFDGRKLGHWLDRLPPYTQPVLAYGSEARDLKLGFRTWKGRRTLMRAVVRTAYSMVPGVQRLTMGRSLVGQLLHVLIRRGVPLWTNVEITDLVTTGAAVTGVEGRRNGQAFRVRAGGVVIATGGFARNAEMRQKYGQGPATGAWSGSQDGDTGDGIVLAQRYGAAVAEMDEAWWEPSVILPNGKPVIAVAERFLPHSIMVDSKAQRYMNEALPYVEAGQVMLRHHREIPSVPSWMIFDSQYHDRYVFLTQPPRRFPTAWRESGLVREASDLASLAAACELDAQALTRTVERFNGFAREGVDEDFGRGSNSYEHYYADPRNRPNPSLGTIEKGPFFAVPIYPGDVGTCGGVVTDEHGRVLTPEGSAVEGLYATGNSAAPVFGANYPGAGASIAHAMVFGVRAADHLSSQARSG